MIHRDYFSEGRVLIEIYADRVEISNPGGLLFKESDLGKRSLARNPLLVDLVHRLRFVERIGSGIKRVKELMGDKIEFDLDPNWFGVIIKRSGTVREGVKWSEKWSDSSERQKEPYINRDKLIEILSNLVGSKLVEKVGSKLAENQLKILILVKEKPNIIKKELSKILGISTTAIDKNISKLKELNLLKRIGPDKGGHWDINKNEKRTKI